MDQIKAPEAVFARFGQFELNPTEHSLVFARLLQFLSKVSYKGLILLKKGIVFFAAQFLDEVWAESKCANHSLRLLCNIFGDKEVQEELKALLSEAKGQAELGRINAALRVFLKQEDVQRFCNSCNLAGFIVELEPRYLSDYKASIPVLIGACKDKTGDPRKNSAILLAKLAKNQENLELLRELHGIEVLHSITSFVVNKK